MSVNVPVYDFKTKTQSDSDIYPYGFAGTSGELDTAVDALGKVFRKMLKLAQIEKAAQLMAEEIEKTRRRVNALEYVMIPDTQEAIRYINMETKLIDLTNIKGQQRIVEEKIEMAADIIRSGGLLAIPTETVYGLGANALNPEAVRRIFEAKGRPQDNPLIIHVPSAQWLPRFCEDVPPLAYTLARNFWPGPLTMILKRKPVIPDVTTAGLNSVGVRCPAHLVTQAIIRYAGVPIAAPSANTSGRPSCTTAADVAEDMSGKIEGIVDGGPCSVGVESTIIDLTVTPPRLLRPGGLPLEDLQRVLGEIEVDKAVTAPLGEDEKPRAPGMKYRHYAPKAAVTVFTGNPRRTAQAIVQRLKAGTGVICFDEFASLFQGHETHLLGPVDDKEVQAQRVFDALRTFDGSDVTEILAQCPDNRGLGLAIGNRLKKAAGFHDGFMEEIKAHRRFTFTHEIICAFSINNSP